MSDSTERHLERHDYDGFLEALQDADAVAVDLIQAVQGQLLVPAERVEFLTRRLRQLVIGCIRAADGQP